MKNIVYRAIMHFHRKRVYRLLNGRYAGKTNFEKKRKLLNSIGHEIGEGTKIVGPIFASAKLHVGKNCWIGAFFKATGNGEIFIGDNCDVAPEVTFATGGHKIGSSDRRAGEGVIDNIHVGSGCWICQRSLLLQGSQVKSGSIVAAGAVVTKTITEENVLLAGVPATIKKRYR